MKINKCPKCGREPIIVPLLFLSDGHIGCYKLRCNGCNLSVASSGDFTNIHKAVSVWNELTKGENK